MTTLQSQINFIQELRDSYDNEQRERILVKHPPEKVAEFLRDIHENLLAVKLWQVKQEVLLCHDCGQPLNPRNKVAFGVDEKHIVVSPEEDVCDRCTQIRLDRANQTVGIP